jgi:hypothetical protein
MLLTSTQSPLKDLHIALLHFNILMNFFYVSKNNNKSNEITARVAAAAIVRTVIVVKIIVKLFHCFTVHFNSLYI